MKNRPIDLHNILFEQLERLNDDEMVEGEKLNREIQRANALCKVSGQVIANRNSVANALKSLEGLPDTKKTTLLLE
jgi:hypothetical protein